MDDNDWLAERFEADRARLRVVAYRMLGSRSEADDAVQEAWLRLSRSQHGEIDDLRRVVPLEGYSQEAAMDIDLRRVAHSQLVSEDPARARRVAVTAKPFRLPPRSTWSATPGVFGCSATAST